MRKWPKSGDWRFGGRRLFPQILVSHMASFNAWPMALELWGVGNHNGLAHVANGQAMAEIMLVFGGAQ